MLLAEVPEHPASASLWRLCGGFHWRLHVYHRTRHTAGLTVSIARESNNSDVRIDAQVRLVSNHFLKPVRNLTVASKESFPHERNLTVQLSAGVTSKCIKFHPIAVPLGRFVVGVSLDVQECFSDGEGRSRGISPSFGSGERVERFADSYSIERSIAWLGETDSLSEPTRKNVRVAAGLHTENSNGSDGVAVPYNLSTLLQSCNKSEQGSIQASYFTFSDVTLTAGSGADIRTFNLHRCVLALASPVFRAMLTSEMVEKRTGIVTLPNFTSSTVNVAVRHIYGFSVDVTQHVFELYHFAHQFDIVSLLHKTRQKILHEMGLQSCGHILRFGVTFRDEEVVNAARHFIATRFTDIIYDDVASREMNHVPKGSLLQILEDDMIRATEFEILLFAMRWLSMNEGIATRDVFKRIRWRLISPEILGFTEIIGLSSFSSERAAVGQAETKKNSHEEEEKGGRWVGRPNATLWVPFISKPPEAFLPSKHLMKNVNKRKTSRQGRAKPSNHIEASFAYNNLRWMLRAKLDECKASLCCGTRLSASLWLEEGDNGRVWTEDGRDSLPVRVLANFMVWNHLGGQLHVVPIDVVFRSAGWANGWCVRDLLDGGTYALRDYGEAVQVAVEIREVVQV